MTQNRNKLIDLFIGNISNAIIHKLLAKAIDNDNVRSHYDKELIISFKKAREYRDKINPVKNILPDKDVSYIKDKIIKKVKAELELRISKGYENIDIDLVEIITDDILKDIGVI